jgi:uncharacterized protein (TIGR00255 family)
MTGYAYRESRTEAGSVSVEIKGYNSRFLEISVTLPVWLSGLEGWIRSYLEARVARGKIEASVRIRDDGAVNVTVNAETARAYRRAAEELASILGTEEKPGLEFILGMEGVLESGRDRDDEKYRTILEPVLDEAVRDFESERLREGKRTEEEILRFLDEAEDSLNVVEDLAPVLEETIKKNLRNRFNELLEDRIDENRILAETAVLLMKYTISEETARLHSHFGEFRAEIARNPGPGKKLDFLCQEINREINTIGSKTPRLEVSRAVVQMKNTLENIREQLRNVE